MESSAAKRVGNQSKTNGIMALEIQMIFSNRFRNMVLECTKVNRFVSLILFLIL